MENGLKKLSQEIKLNIEAAIATLSFKDVISATKAAEDSGTFEVIVSTADIDRSGESVDQNGWNLELYKMNPIVLWGHDYYSLPIGVCDSIEVVEGKLVAKGRFAPAEANPFAQQVRKLYDAQIVRATSVGFIVSEMNGNVITKAELLEFSFVPVPANPYALSLSQAKTLGLDIAMIAMKGLNSMMKKEEGGEEETPASEETPVVETPEEVAPVVETPAEETVVEEKTVSIKMTSEEMAQAVGAELATMQATIDTAIVDGSQRILKIIQGEEDAEDDSEEEKTADDGVTPEGGAIEEVKSAKADVFKELGEFEDTRFLLRALATATTNALENLNKKAREHEAAK